MKNAPVKDSVHNNYVYAILVYKHSKKSSGIRLFGIVMHALEKAISCRGICLTSDDTGKSSGRKR